MAMTATRQGKVRQLLSCFVAQFLLTPSGSYPAGGEVIDFIAPVPGPGIGYTNKQPIEVSIAGKAGYLYQYDFVNKKVMVRVNTGAGANLGLPEHTAAAYNAGVTADVIVATVLYPKMA